MLATQWGQPTGRRGGFIRGPPGFLLNQTADRSQRWRAAAVRFASVLLFGALVPFVRVPLGQVPAFIPIYESALLTNDAVTAVLLFGQYRILRSRALMVLACAYLFRALMTVIHALTFPGVFSPTGLLGAGPQTTSALYMFWHAGFPLFVLACATLKRREARAGGPASVAAASWQAPAPAHDARALAMPAATVALAALLALWATLGQAWLPTLIEPHRFGIALTSAPRPSGR